MSNELLVLEKLEVVPFFTKGDSLDETLAKIEAEAMAFVAGDLSVGKNRSDVTAMVTKVTNSKTYLEKHRKALADEYKAIPKVIDANGKKVREFLTDLQAKVRKPLTDWEIEDKRIKAEKAEVDRLAKIADEIAFMWEFAWLENEAFDKAKEDARLYEIDQQRIRDKAIADKATKDAEDKAKADIEASRLAELQAKQDLIDQGIENERLKQQAIIDSAHGEALLELRDINDKAAEEQRKLDKIESDKISEANERANVARALADQIAQQEVADKKIADDLADKKANTENRHKVHTAMKEYLVSLGVDGEMATKVVKGMGSDEMPHVVVNY